MINKNNKFIFVMPCYNAEKTITQALLSVISQSYSNWKIIIRDDMSTDNTRIIIDNIINLFGLQEKISVKTNTENQKETKIERKKE